MPERGSRNVATLAIFGIAILLNLVLTALLLDQVDRTRSEMRQLADELATKQDVAMLRPLGVRNILERRCTGCHTVRRFAKTLDMSEPELFATVAKMSLHSGGEIPASEFPQIEAALLVYRCTTCHDESVLSRLILMPHDERLPFLRKKVAMRGSGFRTDQVEELVQAFRVLAEAARN